MMEFALFFGLLLVMLGILLILTSFFGEGEFWQRGENYSRPSERSEKKFGGVVLIGPIPIVFGETRLAVIALVLTIILMLLLLLLFFGWFR